MCDYSLAGIRNRLAEEGEELVTRRFQTGSIGLASPAEVQRSVHPQPHRFRPWQWMKDLFDLHPECPNALAVCIPPGACLILKNIPDRLQTRWDVGDEERVVFVQTSANVNTYRDAVSFGNGRQVLLQELAEGMPVKVVSLGGDPVLEETPVLAIPTGRPSTI